MLSVRSMRFWRYKERRAVFGFRSGKSVKTVNLLVPYPSFSRSLAMTPGLSIDFSYSIIPNWMGCAEVKLYSEERRNKQSKRLRASRAIRLKWLGLALHQRLRKSNS